MLALLGAHHILHVSRIRVNAFISGTQNLFINTHKNYNCLLFVCQCAEPPVGRHASRDTKQDVCRCLFM